MPITMPNSRLLRDQQATNRQIMNTKSFCFQQEPRIVARHNTGGQYVRLDFVITSPIPGLDGSPIPGLVRANNQSDFRSNPVRFPDCCLDFERPKN
jgi:hypothetical protein